MDYVRHGRVSHAKENLVIRFATNQHMHTVTVRERDRWIMNKLPDDIIAT